MTDEPIPADVREFILDCIDSIAQLEALLLLRETPQQDWDVTSLARRIYIGEAEAGAVLSTLVACELAETDGSVFRFHTRDAEHQKLVDDLALAYTRYLVPVTTLVHDKSQNIRKFADAFKFRRDK